MARIFVTGSATGLGFLSGKYLLARGHDVVLHARNPAREADIRLAMHAVSGVVTGDLETLAGMRQVAQAANTLGPFDAVIHNAGVGDSGTDWLTTDGLPLVFAVNVLAPYVLTALMHRPKRLVYLSSSMHFGPPPPGLDKAFCKGSWTGRMSYSQSKFLVTAFAFAVARKWPEVMANAVDPGWVPTRMGGRSAPDDLQLGCETQAWLAETSAVSGGYFHHRQARQPDPDTRSAGVQDRLLALCQQVSGIALPAAGPHEDHHVMCRNGGKADHPDPMAEKG